jgi:hypothetical protein
MQNFIESSTVDGLVPLLNEQVNFGDGTVARLGHYPLVHILYLAQECGREVRSIIERLENDALKPDQFGHLLGGYTVKGRADDAEGEA